MACKSTMTAIAVASWLAFASPAIAASAPCRIEVVEKRSGWPVPLVQLTTTHRVRYVTDNAGLIAIDAPELMNREVFFHVEGHGYDAPKDGFGIRGVRLHIKPGTTIRVTLARSIIAKRIGRLTGAGLFANAHRLGDNVAKGWQESGLVGCDSVQTAVHHGKHFWLWGDTTLQHYPLGIFHMSGATTTLQPITSFEPPLRLRFDYFREARPRQQSEEGSLPRPRSVAKMPGDGPTWLSGFVSLPDKAGRSRLVAHYVKIKPPLEAYEWGLCEWDEKAQRFERVEVLHRKSEEKKIPPPLPKGHPVRWTDADGKRWVLFGEPLPTLRIPESYAAWRDPSQWESLTPQKTLRSAHDGGAVRPHTGSIAYNAYRKRWVTVFMQWFGKPSAFGELWYAEADSPTGPWGPAVKVLSHNNYTFYNPRLHPTFTPKGSPILLFEGTYTAQFADKPLPTPRYDYNQVLYRLDLDDARLKPAHHTE